MTKWHDIESGGKKYPMGHLHNHLFTLVIDGEPFNIETSYLHHVFTDENGEGRLFKLNKETRYFCYDRYDMSLGLPRIIRNRLYEGYFTRYKSNKEERFYFHDASNYAIFFKLVKKRQDKNTLKLQIISAYDPDIYQFRPPPGKQYSGKHVFYLKATQGRFK